jgi:hypothetical protein
VLKNGLSFDVTDDLVGYMLSDILSVRYPQEDSFGTCH